MTQPGISACLIVKNEEHNLRECLESIQQWVDEICVVDTGSSDSTVAIAQEFNAKTARFAWNDSFADARNASLDLATREWILVIDADERLRQQSGPVMRMIVQNTTAKAFLLYQDNPSAEAVWQSVAIPRLFRNHPDIRFSRRVHESVMESLLRLGEGSPEIVDIHLHHVGYSREQIEIAGKNERNKRLLRVETGERGDDMFSFYKLGQTLDKELESEERLLAFKHVISLAEQIKSEERRDYPFLPLAYDGYAEMLVFHGELAMAGEILRKYGSSPVMIPELVWREADIDFRTGDLESAMNAFQRCLGLAPPDPRIPSDAKFRGVAARARLGDIALELGDPQSFMQLVGEISGSDELGIHCEAQYIRALLFSNDVEAAFNQLEQLAHDHGDNTEVRLLQGQIALLQDEETQALEYFSHASDQSDSGQRARAMRMLVALQNNDVATAASLRDEMVVREIRTAAIVLLVNVLTEERCVFDSAFSPQHLTKKLTYWLSQLVDRGNPEILRTFMRNSSHYIGQFPGIDQLLQQE